LIYGLPFQTADSFNRTLDTVLQMSPDRLAVFSYAHVPWVKPAQKILEQKILPTAEVKLQLLKTSSSGSRKTTVTFTSAWIISRGRTTN